MLFCYNLTYICLELVFIYGFRRSLMYISKLTIRNFRNFQNATFIFKKGVNTLIGENGSGKTNVFYALRLLIDDSLPIRSRVLEESDFNRSIGDWRGHWIIIYVEFDELDTSEECGILARHATQNVNDCNKGSYAMYFRPKKAIRQKLHEISKSTENKNVEFQKLLSEITIDDYETVFPCRGQADFADDTAYKMYVGDFDGIIFPNPEDLVEDQLGCPSPSIFSFSKSVSCTFIKALRDVMADLRNSRTNPLIHLLRGTEKEIDIRKAEEITKQVNQLNEDISNLDEIQKISNGTKSMLEHAVGKTYAPKLDIKSELPNNIEKLLQSLTLWVGDPDDGGYQGKIEELSLGGANLIFLSLKLLEYDLKQSTDKLGHFLLIEEPEAHIHTHIQKTLFSKIKSKNTQVIISTHSTHISDASKISAVNILCKEFQKTKVFQPSNGLNSIQIAGIERYLDAVRSTLLFAKGVILVEGDAELILIPQMVKSVFGISLDEIGISLINMSSTVFEHVALIFNDKRVQRKCSIITDGDASIINLPKNYSFADLILQI